jgi:hypothetical protein
MDEQSEKVAELRMFYRFDCGTPEERLLRCNLSVKTSLEFIKQDEYTVGTPALLYFARVLGYDKGLRMWKEPVNYMNKLAGILWCMHALVVEHSLPLNGRNDLGSNLMVWPMHQFKKV